MVETITTSKIHVLTPYTDALMLANGGINEMQARTMVYYAYLTYFRTDPMPLLLILKDFGCGKSDLLDTLFPMCDGARRIEGTTYAKIRDELHLCRAAFFDENENLPERLLSKRFKRSNSMLKVNKPVGGNAYQEERLDISGATVIGKRIPFKDVALMSRCLIIQPAFCEVGDFYVTDVGSLSPVVGKFSKPEEFRGSGRTMQVWKPLENVARLFGDEEWLEWAKEEFAQDAVITQANKQYEPAQAVLGALQIIESGRDVMEDAMVNGDWVKLSAVKRVAQNEFEQKVKPSQVSEMLMRADREVTTIDGYPVVRKLK